MSIILKILKVHENAQIPKYQTEGSSGMDLHAIEDVVLHPGVVKLVRTGLKMEIPAGFEIQIRPRSGLSLKTPLRIANSPGTVDSDYTGEIMVIMENNSHQREYEIKCGDRIAQAVLCPVVKCQIVEGESINETNRGQSGFGSTGSN